MAYGPYWSVWNVLLSVLVFAVFQKFIFGKLVTKHTARIRSYAEERHFFLKFFDAKAFAVMAVMMTGGVGLRASGIAPDRFIAVFYTGLGASLLLAGLLFGSIVCPACEKYAQSVPNHVQYTQISIYRQIFRKNIPQTACFVL